MPGTWRQATCYQVTHFLKFRPALVTATELPYTLTLCACAMIFCWFLSLLLVQRAQLGQAGKSFFGNPHQKDLPSHSIRKYKYRDTNTQIQIRKYRHRNTNANHHQYNIFHLILLTPPILTCHPCCGCLGGFVVVGYPEPKKEVFKHSFDHFG